MRMDSRAIAHWLTEHTGRTMVARPAAAVYGGSINECWRWPGEGGDAFVKVAAAERCDMFEAEAAGLEALRQADAVRVPRVLAQGIVGSHCVLALEWLELASAGDADAAVQARLGEQLAMQHRVTAPRYGWERDNTIGSTPQPNAWHDDWVEFFVHRRLAHQLQLAADGGLAPSVVERGHELCARCGAFYTSYRPVPSLLHGDLWGGNWARHATTHEPVIFDPAVYYGDREADIAMTRLFGGFGSAFYAAYQAAWPLDQAAGTRRTLYNLYHVLNHYHLFGGSYAAQAAQMIERLLAEFG
jgi:fructosamine-3-kinase